MAVFPLSPRPPLPKSGWRLACTALHRWFRLKVGAFLSSLVVVTAALGISCLRARPKGFAIALWKPSPPAYKLVSYPALVGRGGSVSRRDHNRAARNRAQLTGATCPEKRVNSNPSYSSGEGVWGRGASLREAASPPESPSPHDSISLNSFNKGLRFLGVRAGSR